MQVTGSAKYRDDLNKSSTLVSKAHAELKHNILIGHHKPGEKLRIEHLKVEYGVSGGTLREALTLLVADRLVLVEDQRGFRVMPVSFEDLSELHAVRVFLAKEAIRKSILNGDAEWEGRVVSAYHLLSRTTRRQPGAAEENPDLVDEWEERHRTFHLLLVAGAKSQWLQQLMQLTYPQSERYRRLFAEVAKEKRPERDVGAEHRALLEAVVNRDPEAGARAIEDHMEQTFGEWERYYRRTGTLPSAEA